MYIFPQLVKSMHIFFPIDLKYTKLPKKRLDIFRLWCAPPHYNTFLWGKNINQKEGGGAKI